jgi:hypothetical protein
MARRQRRQNAISGQWVAYRREMLESPGFQVLSRAARQIMHRLELEHMHQGGAENGALKCTYADFVRYGVNLAAVAPALRELEALRFVEVIERGCGGNSDQRHPSIYRLTYLLAKGARGDGSHEWRQIKTIEEAEALAKNARPGADPMKVERGRRQAARKHNSAADFHSEAAAGNQ